MSPTLCLAGTSCPLWIIHPGFLVINVGTLIWAAIYCIVEDMESDTIIEPTNLEKISKLSLTKGE